MLDPRFVFLGALFAAAACHTAVPADPSETDVTTQIADPTEVTPEAPISTEEQALWDALAGTYEIVAGRRASETAAPLDAVDMSDDPRGERFTIATRSVTLDGASCDAWRVTSEPGPDVMDRDPMLDDLRLPGLDATEPQSGQTYNLTCEGEHVFTMYKADPRAMAIFWDNGVSFLIAEMPLTPPQILKFQTQMRDMKFQSGVPSDSWTASGLIGLRSYYGYRTQSKDAYIFDRPAITASLLEKLGVLDAE